MFLYLISFLCLEDKGEYSGLLHKFEEGIKKGVYRVVLWQASLALHFSLTFFNLCISSFLPRFQKTWSHLSQAVQAQDNMLLKLYNFDWLCYLEYCSSKNVLLTCHTCWPVRSFVLTGGQTIEGVPGTHKVIQVFQNSKYLACTSVC